MDYGNVKHKTSKECSNVKLTFKSNSCKNSSSYPALTPNVV